MNTGIQDAIMLAGVLSGRTGEAHLDGYEATRRPVAIRVVAATDRLTRAVTARNPLVRAVRSTFSSEHTPENAQPGL